MSKKKEVVIIASRVFVWAAIERILFDTRGVSQNRRKILQLLSAEILSAGKENTETISKEKGGE